MSKNAFIAGVAEHGDKEHAARLYPRPIPIKFEPTNVTEENIVNISKTFGSLRFETLLGMLASEFMSQGVELAPFLAAVKMSRNSPLESLRHGYVNCNKASDWFGLIASVTECIPIAWRLLDDRDRPRFLRMKSDVSNVLYGIAPSHALRMLTELEHNTLEVFGNLSTISYDEKTQKFRVLRGTTENTTEDLFDTIVDCTGFGTNIENSETILLKNLLKREFLKPHHFGGAVVDFYSGQVAELASGRALNIYCLSGTLNIGTRLATNGLGEVAGSALRTAQVIHSRFDGADHDQKNSPDVR
jgi:uncharacterized NAD(P)/FAD-binding protein YdhS